MRNNIAIFTAAIIAFGTASAQELQPIDPLQRPKVGAGSTSFSISTDYAGASFGNVATLGSGLNLSGAYNISEQVAVTASTGLSFIRTEQTTGSVFDMDWNTLSFGAQYTSRTRYAPTLGLTVALPLTGSGWAVTSSTSASLLRDPLSLDASLAMTWQSEGPCYIAAGAGINFVVNDIITLRGSATQSLVFDAVMLPSAAIGLGGAYKLSEKNSINARTTINIADGRASTGISLAYVYRS